MPSFFHKHGQFLLVLVACCAIHTFVFLRSIPVFYLPDLVLILYLAYKFKDLNQEVSLFFFVGLGLLAIVAAIAYTVGKRPYGYMGLGDISVFLFFGWVGTFGTYYLQTEVLNYYILINLIST